MIASLLARLLAESPSIRAAMKAGRRTAISCRVYRAAQNEWQELGTVGSNEGVWADMLARLAHAKIVVRFRYKGKEIERSTY